MLQKSKVLKITHEFSIQSFTLKKPNLYFWHFASYVINACLDFASVGKDNSKIYWIK